MISKDEVQRRHELWGQGYWEIPEGLDTSTFDFTWKPEPYDRPYIHQFGTQHQKTGGPRFIVPKNEGTKYQNFQHAIKLPNINNRSWRPLLTNCTIDFSWHPDDTEPPFIYVFGNQWYDSHTMPTYQYRVKGATEKKYLTDITATILPSKDNWEIPDYITEFDYSWVPSPYEPSYIQQFSTEWGDVEAGPRYVPKNAEVIKRNSLLIAKSDTEHIADELVYVDSIFDALIEHKFQKPYVHIKRNDSKIDPYNIVCSDDRLIHVVDSLEAIVSSKVPLTRFFDKITDYQEIKHHFLNLKTDLLDIIFFSNGEACADSNYEHLLSLKLPNRIVRIDGVDGRVASQHAAANASNTPWYFLVNAKLKVNKDFDFTWRPNVLKSRRHYIFTATNIVNGLEYGHQAIVANNKILTLNTVVRGLDFTMDSHTEVMNINSGLGMYNSSAWDAWRTSFRECIKLMYANDSESKNRLNIWRTVGTGPFSEYSIKGANDAVEYYNSVSGYLNKLMLSYDWEWLRNKFDQNS